MLLFALFGLAAGCAKEEVRIVNDSSVVGTISERADWDCDCKVYIVGGSGYQALFISSGINLNSGDPIHQNDVITMQSSDPDAFVTLRILCSKGQGEEAQICSDETCTLNFSEGNTTASPFFVTFNANELECVDTFGSIN